MDSTAGGLLEGKSLMTVAHVQQDSMGAIALSERERRTVFRGQQDKSPFQQKNLARKKELSRTDSRIDQTRHE